MRTALLLVMGSAAFSITDAGAQSSVFDSLLNSSQSIRDGDDSPFDKVSGAGPSPLPPEPEPEPETPSGDAFAWFESQTHPQIVDRCILCHVPNGLADSGGAELLFSPNGAANQITDDFAALETYIAGAGRASRMLSKIAGTDHGGGLIFAQGSDGYTDFETFTDFYETGSDAVVTNVWEGVSLESRAETLRRAAILIVQRLPTAVEYNQAEASEDGLRGVLKRMMREEAFKTFIMRGANDMLLFEGFRNGAAFDYDQYRYPEFQNYGAEIWDTYYAQGGYDLAQDAWSVWEFDVASNGMWEEPLQLIAYIAANNRPYTEVVTADYTMVNGPLNRMYRAGKNLAEDDRETWVPGSNNGWVALDNNYQDERVATSDVATRVTGHSPFMTVPAAGILSTPGWLMRYPTTETNRNRARARWTYYHFLGVDIENSSSRTTDPVALADTNNPTLNNPACTVCHERMDPVAGAYQGFGINGGYLQEYDALDSLPNCYKYPENCGGEFGSTDYEFGDTWFADMRDPGFEGGEKAPASLGADTLPWLGQKIAADPRFGAATVRFWWQAVMGAEPLRPPTDATNADFAALQAAYDAQNTAIQTMADDFSANGFKLQELLIDMFLSEWFRAAEFDMADSDPRWRTLDSAGSGRLLGPYELAGKVKAAVGYAWQDYGPESSPYERPENNSNLTSIFGYRILYGGADGAGIPDKSRDATAVMATVAERQAAELACVPVLTDMLVPANERGLFTLVEPDDRADSYGHISGDVDGGEVDISDYSFDIEAARANGRTVSLTLNADAGDVYLAMGPADTEVCFENGCNQTLVDEVRIYRGNSLIETLSASELATANTDETTGGVLSRGGAYSPNLAGALIPITLPSTGGYRIEVDAFAELYHPEQGNRFRVGLRPRTASFDSYAGARMRPQLELMQDRFLGVTSNEAELERMYNLLISVLQERDAARSSGQWIYVYDYCDYSNNPEFRYELPLETYFDLTEDNFQMKTAWAVLVSYLLNHYEFTHD